jgi:hypothetical protein
VDFLNHFDVLASRILLESLACAGQYVGFRVRLNEVTGTVGTVLALVAADSVTAVADIDDAACSAFPF